MKPYHSALLLCPLLSVAVAVPATAQRHPARSDVEEVTIINSSAAGSDTISVYETFAGNAPASYHISGAPRFAIVGKDRKFYLGIGGTAKATLSYDWGDPIHNPFDFTTSAIPMSTRPGDGGLVQFSGATSGLFLNVVALPGNANQIGAYVSFNFTGNTDYAFNLQYAYLKYRGITAGYNYSLFSDMAAAPPSIDYEGPCGFTAIPNGVVDYELAFARHWKFGVGLEKPIVSATTGDDNYVVSQRVPDIPAYIQYSWGGGSNWLRFSAILRNMLYRDVKAGRNRDQAGWGVKVSGSSALCAPVRAYWQAAYGKGMTSYFQDLYEGGLDMVPDADKPGRMSPVEAWGGYIGLQYTLSPTVFMTTTYSHVRNYAPRYSGGSTSWDSQYSYAQYALANIMWTIRPGIQCGLEYIYGRRVDMNGSSRHDNRIQTMLQFSF